MRDAVQEAVATFTRPDDLLANAHDRATRDRLARSVADLLGLTFAGEDRRAQGPVRLLIPADTLVSTEAEALGVRGAEDLWGGAAPFAHVATKAISHGLIRPDAAAPTGWNPDLAEALGDAVLTGTTAFSHDDAIAAGIALLSRGPVRVKQVHAVGGRGQTVAPDQPALETALKALSGTELAAHGVVLEENLSEVETYSVGTSMLGPHRIAYWGVQRFVAAKDGGEYYAGSDLDVAQGSLDDLLSFELPAKARRAIELARRYDDAVFAAYPGLFASRRNYDVIFGTDIDGAPRAGVLEQSWRVGGASGAELAAIQAFDRDPSPRIVRSFTQECRDAATSVPPDATLYYQGVDPEAGPMTKFAGLRP